MEIRWEVDDGYVGGSAPQHTEVDDEEIMECGTVQDAISLINDCILIQTHYPGH